MRLPLKGVEVPSRTTLLRNLNPFRPCQFRKEDYLYNTLICSKECRLFETLKEAVQLEP